LVLKNDDQKKKLLNSLIVFLKAFAFGTRMFLSDTIWWMVNGQWWTIPIKPFQKFAAQ